MNEIREKNFLEEKEREKEKKRREAEKARREKELTKTWFDKLCSFLAKIICFLPKLCYSFYFQAQEEFINLDELKKEKLISRKTSPPWNAVIEDLHQTILSNE
jgi:hypothetical protein